MNHGDQRPRLSIDVPLDLRNRVRDAIPFGCMVHVLEVVLEDLVGLLEADDEKTLYALIMARKVKLTYKVRQTDGKHNEPSTS